MSRYLPASVLPICYKIFEKVIYNKLIFSYMEIVCLTITNYASDLMTPV